MYATPNLEDFLLHIIDDPEKQILPRVSIDTFAGNDYVIRSSRIRSNSMMLAMPTQYSINFKNTDKKDRKGFLFGTILVLVAIATSVVTFLIEFAALQIFELRSYVSFLTDLEYINIIIWVSTSVLMANIAVSFGHWLCQAAEGSGFAEIRVHLTGIEIPNFLT